MTVCGKPKKIPCKICGKLGNVDHISRHMKRFHTGIHSIQSIEYSETVSEVLRRCGIEIELMAHLDPGTLNSLPNMRVATPRPRRHHVQWHFRPMDVRSGLPNLESLLVDVSHMARSHGIGEEVQVWEGNDLITFSDKDWDEWAKAILNGSPVSSRVFNLPADSFISESEKRQFGQFATEVAKDIYKSSGARDLVRLPPDIVITPRQSLSTVHHDSNPGVSIAVGSPKHADQALKLWLIWPSTELHHLTTCYGDTKAAVQQMDHGSFFVQMYGDTLAVPANSPHSVITLNSCYLYGHSFKLDGTACDPPCVRVDMAAGVPSYDACDNRVEKLRLGLCHPTFRQAYIDQALQTWATEASVFRDPMNSRQYKRLLEVWCDDVHKQNSCAWCTSTSCEYAAFNRLALTRHMEEHLNGKTPANTGDTRNRQRLVYKRNSSAGLELAGKRVKRASKVSL